MIVFSPTWRVPPRIIRDEIVPKALTDSMYLTRQGMELVRKGEVVPATPENLALVGDSIGVRQRPGDVNALGMVKFIFPNPYGVYLHDTPTKSTFRLANRAESHGCIRLADAPSLATWLLRADSAWTAERMKEAMASPKPIDVTLGQGVPVRLVYETAVPRERRRRRFRRGRVWSRSQHGTGPAAGLSLPRPPGPAGEKEVDTRTCGCRHAPLRLYLLH